MPKNSDRNENGGWEFDRISNRSPIIQEALNEATRKSQEVALEKEQQDLETKRKEFAWFRAFVEEFTSCYKVSDFKGLNPVFGFRSKPHLELSFSGFDLNRSRIVVTRLQNGFHCQLNTHKPTGSGSTFDRVIEVRKVEEVRDAVVELTAIMISELKLGSHYIPTIASISLKEMRDESANLTKEMTIVWKQ